ncbi:cyclic nucleotide-binding domain-containing protein [Flectobacillus major]|jgi:CRP-like cAMP-binding protein|uniref:cyclic nucleotide-binding domain-containing protein n=1 Tax=Flectobacillus major TaxID=103 RepID=UPI0004157D8B|nr:cyclic nucleotide-binding domain-containing protein [Flectobacillus major]
MRETERKILASGIELSFKGGEFLYRKGQEAEFVFYLKDGKFELIDGHNDPIRIEGFRCFLGLEELLSDKQHRYSVKALSNAQVLVFEKSLLNTLIYEYELAQRYFMLKMCDYMAFHESVYE